MKARYTRDICNPYTSIHGCMISDVNRLNFVFVVFIRLVATAFTPAPSRRFCCRRRVAVGVQCGGRDSAAGFVLRGLLGGGGVERSDCCTHQLPVSRALTLRYNTMHTCVLKSNGIQKNYVNALLHP